MSISLRILAVLALLTSAGTAQAGTWTKLDPVAPGGCTLQFRGEIETGDFSTSLEAVLQTEPFESPALQICLDSPGGSQKEVLTFIETFEGGFQTRIRSGDQCRAACAILFMFGQDFSGANRQIEPGAELVFRSPFINGIEGQTPPSPDDAATALRIVKMIADRGYQTDDKGASLMPRELLSVLLDPALNETRHVKTRTELELLNITLTQDPEAEFEIKDDYDTIERLLKRVCISSHTLTFRRAFVKKGYVYGDLVRRATDAVHMGPDYKVTAFERHSSQYQPIGTPEDESFDDRLLAMLTGPGYSHPGKTYLSDMYCRVEMTLAPTTNGFRVTNYQADFDLILRRDVTRIPAEGNLAQPSFSAGLLPLDTPY